MRRLGTKSIVVCGLYEIVVVVVDGDDGCCCEIELDLPPAHFGAFLSVVTLGISRMVYVEVLFEDVSRDEMGIIQDGSKLEESEFCGLSSLFVVICRSDVDLNNDKSFGC